MNYAFLIPGKDFTALERQSVKRAADALAAGHSAIVFCRRNSKVHRFANSLNVQTDFIHISNPYIDFFSALQLSSLSKKYEINICVVCKTKYLAIAVTASMLNNRNIKVFLYQQILSEIKKRDFYHNFIYKRLHAAVVLTNSMKLSMTRNTIFPPDKINVIPYGIDVDAFHPSNFDKTAVRKALLLPESKFIVGNTTPIHKSNDQITGLRAFHRAAIPDSLFVLCGDVLPENNNYILELNKEIETLGIRDRVVFIPKDEHSHEILNAFDVLLTTSRFESFPIITIEALASGLPVVSVCSVCTKEIITNNENGFLAEPKDVEALADYLKALHDSPETIQKFREINLEWIKRNYDLETQTGRFFDFVK